MPHTVSKYMSYESSCWELEHNGAKRTSLLGMYPQNFPHRVKEKKPLALEDLLFDFGT
jgi:hypothetical protein